MHEIDEIDRRILSELQRDATAGVEQIGERIGLSRNACWRRIKLLEQSGVIRAKVALIDAEKAVDCGILEVVQPRKMQDLSRQDLFGNG